MDCPHHPVLSQKIKHTFSQFVGAILIRYQHQTTGELSEGKTLVWEGRGAAQRFFVGLPAGPAVGIGLSFSLTLVYYLDRGKYFPERKKIRAISLSTYFLVFYWYFLFERERRPSRHLFTLQTSVYLQPGQPKARIPELSPDLSNGC